MLTQYAYAKLKGVNRSYICRLVKDGRIILVGGKVDPVRADEVLDEPLYTRRKDNAMRHLIETALSNFAWFCGERGMDADRISKIAESYMGRDEFDKHLRKFGHPGLNSCEIQLKEPWEPVDAVLERIGS